MKNVFLIKKPTTDWAQKFANGGPMLQIQKILEDAAAEIQAGKPGIAVQKVKTMRLNPAYNLILTQLSQNSPEISELLTAIDQVGETPVSKNGSKLNYIHTLRCGGKPKKKLDGGEIEEEKCGGKAKKAVKKAGAGCKCKLAKVGNKLVNIDCNGAIVKLKK